MLGTARLARLVAVPRSVAEAEAVARQGAEWTITSYANQSRRSSSHDIRSRQAQAANPSGQVRDPIQRYVDDVIVHGSPARLTDELQRLRTEMHLDYLLCATLSHESFLLLTDEVIPKLA